MTDNPYLRRVQKRLIGHHGHKSEDRIAKSLNAKQTPASGAMAGATGDMRVSTEKRRWKIEAKSTKSESMVLQLDWLRKIKIEANESSAYPMLTISFVTEAGLPKDDGDWVLMPRWVLDGLEEFDQ